MDCYRHEGTASVATCVGCSQPVCEECREEVAGHPMCRPCVAAAEARLASPPSPGSAVQPAATTEPDLAAEPGPVTVPPTELPDEVTMAPIGNPPGLLRRLGRGWLWGIWYAQWWTLMLIVSGFIWGHGWPGTDIVVERVIFYGFIGSIAGLIVGVSNASVDRGSLIGIGIGILLCLMEVWMSKEPRRLVNLVFFYFTGQFVGAGIAARVQQPVLPRKG